MRNFAVNLDAIREHYNTLSLKYLRFWGDHIHHGFWEDGESPKQAQVKLIERLAERAQVPRNARVLDVGCGIGSSTLWLAENLNTTALGISNSPVQIEMARERAVKAGLQEQVRFEVFDANHLENLSGRFDVIWIIECSEHLFDKARFFRNCARLLKDDGCLALCAGLQAEEFPSGAQEQLLKEVCEGMLCPFLGRMSDYTNWLRDSGFGRIIADDITRHVTQTWKICRALCHHPELDTLLYSCDESMRGFVQAFRAIDRAYSEGAMAYGMFTAIK